MIPNKIRESRRVKALKLPKNLERLYKDGKCRECAVVVTRMDFAKILGKFTKVKIQYESSTTPKTKQNAALTSPNTTARLKNNENGMVLIRRNAYNQHPVIKKTLKKIEPPRNESLRSTSNVLKENNRLKKTVPKDKNSSYAGQKKKDNTSAKLYCVVFEDPVPHNNNNNNDIICKVSLSDLLPQITDTILPSEEWCIDFFPKKGELKDDKVYDRIAAELEDLMYSDQPTKPNEKIDTAETKADDFPSIMDILNDNSSENKTNDQSSTLEFKSSLESSDVEAMLLGKSNPANSSDPVPSTPMDVDSDMSNLIQDVNQFTVIPDNEHNEKLPAANITEDMENPESPSILDDNLQKDVGELLPNTIVLQPVDNHSTTEGIDSSNVEEKVPDITIKDTTTDAKISLSIDNQTKETLSLASIEGLTHLIFKNTKDGTSLKTVTFPKNLKYDIEIEGKSVEFIGAPKLVSSSEDLQVLLEIVNESELSNVYVLH